MRSCSGGLWSWHILFCIGILGWLKVSGVNYCFLWFLSFLLGLFTKFCVLWCASFFPVILLLIPKTKKAKEQLVNVLVITLGLKVGHIWLKLCGNIAQFLKQIESKPFQFMVVEFLGFSTEISELHSKIGGKWRLHKSRKQLCKQILYHLFCAGLYICGLICQMHAYEGKNFLLGLTYEQCLLHIC